MFDSLTFIPYDLGMTLAFSGAMVAMWGLVIVGFITCARSSDGMCA